MVTENTRVYAQLPVFHQPLLPRLFMSSHNCLDALFTLHPAQARSGTEPHCHDKVHGEVNCEHAYVYTRPAQSASASRNCKQNETIAVAPPTCQRDTHLPEQLLLQPAAGCQPPVRCCQPLPGRHQSHHSIVNKYYQSGKSFCQLQRVCAVLEIMLAMFLCVLHDGICMTTLSLVNQRIHRREAQCSH
ncbi:hypothetical protein COO60DRAFT_1108953 [Scenedesmus sp. NREL 46B-D3]|nr:hypothetical protein COO60DRAFT_1108953 [Scenedesmus sp. NREL 46B-D3]